MMQALNGAFAPMARYRQFLCYVLAPSTTRPGKTDKLPVSPYTGQVVTAHDPQHWTDAATACATAGMWGASYGVAFVFTPQDPFFFIDIDDCFDGQSWSPLAQQVASMFPGAAMELSQSGNGMHLFGTGRAPEHAKRNDVLHMEFYTEARFVALTGVGAMGNAGTDHTAALAQLTAQWFPPRPGGQVDGSFALSDEPDPEWRGPTDDADLIRRALQSRSAAGTFGGRATFADLWENNTEALAKSFPDPGRLYNASAADAALAAHLAFWTGRHGERIQSLMLQSGLVRDKWHRDDYLPRTIATILAAPGDVLVDKLPEPPSLPGVELEAPRQSEVTGQTFLGPAAQRDLFAGCIYVMSQNKVLVPGGMLLDQARFRAAFGGYAFAMDAVNERTTRNAWEAFTESQVLRAPRADSICFKPDQAPGAIIDSAGKTRANTWWPAKVARTVGDVSPFLDHLRRVLPNERDRDILLAYMAAVVQHKGVKFGWWPVLQGVEGNGKTLFSACVAEAVGQHYTHWPHAKDVASQFNGWVANKLFVALEELYDAEKQSEVVEALKTLITGGMGIQVQFKGVDQESMSICCNGMATTNYKTAVRKTPDNARRFALFYTAQQTAADLVRDGMTGDYFPKLYGWLKSGGFAIVSELLHTYPIPPELDPAVALHRAPDTSTTMEAIVESRGSVEQQIAEVIAQDTPGFMGGWISSVMLDRLITDTLKMGNRLSHAKRREMLQGMGYVLHPGLPDGRVNNPVQPDGRKPQLFILANHPHAYMRGAAEIARAYSSAQTLNPIRTAP
jgi:Family of unknown function (DUF5906)